VPCVSTVFPHAVCGAIKPPELGVVLPHEYCLVNNNWALRKTEYGRDISGLTMELKNLGKIRHFP
jgi:predicted metal-dependent phosphotriesterase family hydrolase